MVATDLWPWQELDITKAEVVHMKDLDYILGEGTIYSVELWVFIDIDYGFW